MIVRPVDGDDVDGGELKAALDRALGAQPAAPRRSWSPTGALPRIGQNKIDRRSSQALWSELTGR